MTQDKQKPATNQRIRQIGWVVVLVLILILVIGGLKPGSEAFNQALGVRGLLQAGADIPSDEVNNPFVCLPKAGKSNLAKAALPNLNDDYLQGVALCLAGERDAGLAALKEAGGRSYGNVQYAVALGAIDPQAGADTLAQVGLSGDNLAAIMQKLSAQPGIDIYPGFRLLAQKANAQPETWTLWLEGSSRMEANNEWQAALDWLNEGLAVAPQEMRSSLYLRTGRIYQTKVDPADYQAALRSYNQALEVSGWIYPAEEAYAHIYRGEVYRKLKDEFTPEVALEEFITALELQPGNFSALLSIGFVYHNDLKDLDQAEAYYRQAMVAKEQSVYAYYYIGEIYRERGDNATALHWYRLALERLPNWKPAMDRLEALEGK